MSQSPFLLHADILLIADYSAAQTLQRFVLSLWNGNRFGFNASNISNFDPAHMGYFLEFATWYHKHRENDPNFMGVCSQMIAKREKWAAQNRAELYKLTATDPKDYDGTLSDYRMHLHDLDRIDQRNLELGFIKNN